MAHNREVALRGRQQPARRAVLQRLRGEKAAGSRRLAREIGGEPRKRDDARMIGLRVAGGVLVRVPPLAMATTPRRRRS